MALADLADWMDDFGGANFTWYVKRLAANDTLATASHQAGPYVPRDFLLPMFPDLARPEAENPEVWFDLYIDSHADNRKARAVWYNNRLRGGTRNETRLTNLGGAGSALLDPDSTGALVIFAFGASEGGGAGCHVWVCRHETEAEMVEDRLGPVEPGSWLIWRSGMASTGTAGDSKVPACRLERANMPSAWLQAFPAGLQIVQKAVELRPLPHLGPDQRLLRRRDCEFEIFRSVEEQVELPRIAAGFSTIDEFVARAQTVLQRRKSRSGRSLELHAREIFIEDGLLEKRDFSWQGETEPGRRPDFLFPAVDAYRDAAWPQEQMRMLAVKTTCRDRWRQVLNEATRIRRKHLLTLQEGVSESQHREMTEAGVQLVVPEPLFSSYPESVRPNLQSLESFIAVARLIAQRRSSGSA